MLGGDYMRGLVNWSVSQRRIIRHERDLLVHCLGVRQTHPGSAAGRWKQFLRQQHVLIVLSK